MSHSLARPSRAHRSFWVLVVVAVVAVGCLSDALASPPAPATGLRVAGSGLLLVVSTTLAARVLLAIDRTTGQDRETTRSPTTKENHR